MPQENTAALQARIEDLEALLRQNDKYIMVTFKLPPVLANILGLLLAQPLVTPEQITQRLGVADAKAAVHRLRRAVSKWDVTISSGRHLGYWLEPEEKEKLDALLTSRVTSEQAREENSQPS